VNRHDDRRRRRGPLSRAWQFVIHFSLAAAAFTISTSTTLAQPASEPSASELAIARRLFREATELRDKGDWAGTEAKLREVVEIKESAGLRLHLGHALAQNGKLVEALASYDRADELIRAGAKEPEVEKALGPAREALRSRIPSVTVTCAQACELDKVVIDGKPMRDASLGKPILVDPGKHRIQVHAAGRAPFATEIEAREGQALATVASWPEAKPAAPAATGPAPDPADEAAPARSRTAGANGKTIVLVAEGTFALAGITLGLVFRSAANSAEQRAVDQRSDLFARTGTTNFCASPTDELARLCDDLGESNDDRQRNDTLATVSFVAAGVGVGAMIATALLWKDPETTRSATALRLDAGATTDGVHVSLSGVLR
jgi:hypothetical protein